MASAAGLAQRKTKLAHSPRKVKTPRAKPVGSAVGAGSQKAADFLDGIIQENNLIKDPARFNSKRPGFRPAASHRLLAKDLQSQNSSACGRMGFGRG
jgi:hypothetical protein